MANTPASHTSRRRVLTALSMMSSVERTAKTARRGSCLDNTERTVVAATGVDSVVRSASEIVRPQCCPNKS